MTSRRNALAAFSLVLAGLAAAPTLAAAKRETKEFTCANVDAIGVEAAVRLSTYKSDTAFSLQLKQLRAAVKAFHKDAYSDAMTIEEANALGEEVGFRNARALDGKTYTAVNVGFGGGNSATYFFRKASLEPAPVVLIDGVECVVLGKE